MLNPHHPCFFYYGHFFSDASGFLLPDGLYGLFPFAGTAVELIDVACVEQFGDIVYSNSIVHGNNFGKGQTVGDNNDTQFPI